MKMDLIVKLKIIYFEYSFNICTNRPSLLFNNKISRNKVNVLESVFLF